MIATQENISPSIIHFLLKYRKLAIPQVGLLQVNYSPAHFSVADNTLHPPQQKIVFQADNATKIDYHFIRVLSQDLDLNYAEAESLWLAFVTDLVQNLQTEHAANLDLIGRFGWENNTVVFYSNFTSSDYFPDRVIVPRTKSNNQMRIQVGEQERSKEEMEALFQETPKKSRTMLWFILVLIISLGAMIFFMYKDQILHAINGRH